MNIKAKHVNTAYKKLKRLVYYDKNDLHLRKRVADFESDPLFIKKLSAVRKVMNSEDPLHEQKFKTWLNDINFRIVLKRFADKKNPSITNNEGKFISNVTSERFYQIGKVNYFFDGPVELHLIAVLWIMFEGRFLDMQLSKDCYGARLEDSLSNPEDLSSNLFRKYHELYAQWRDLGIRKAKQLLTDEQESVYILGLDIREFYYHVQLDYQSIAHSIYEAGIKESNHAELEESPSHLLKCIEAISSKYREVIDRFLQSTHEDISNPNAGVPIGLCSSPLLANWYLLRFDKAIKSIVRPAYYGRYVDDILLVIAASEYKPDDEDPIMTFMNNVLVKPGLLHKPKNLRYKIADHAGLFLEQNKCILQYFDARHSIAGLEKFQKKLEENGSDFLLMPVDEADSSLEDIAYELLYEGSVNKFRSVKGIAENRYELAKHLARQSILHLLTDDPPDPNIGLGLRKFFKGKNAIEFHDLWERVLTFLFITGDSKAEQAFIKYLRSEIKRVKYEGKSSITKRLVNNLERHLDLCIELSGALKDEDLQVAACNQGTVRCAFRYANLIRHHFVKLPLLNYTNFQGSLITRSVKTGVDVDQRFLKWSPRYVHFDECLMLANSCYVNLDSKNPFQWACDLYKTINKIKVKGIEWDSLNDGDV
jgi:hypothetical protein